MLSIYEAFEKFRSRLELTPTEQEDVSNKHIKMRDLLSSKFPLEGKGLLTGSYARDTKTKPLKDIDIFCILKSNFKQYRWKKPEEVLTDFSNVLSDKYGAPNVKPRRRSVQVKFVPDEGVDDTQDMILSFDVVPAYKLNDDFEIPDSQLGYWIKSNPFIHGEKATDANKGYSQKWKPLVKMVKKWNQHVEKPIDPSFLLEVMALCIITPPAPPMINYPYELKAFFATASERIGETWKDPAGLGPPVSDQMDYTCVAVATKALREAEQAASLAIRLEKVGNTGGALREWHELFGPRFSMT